MLVSVPNPSQYQFTKPSNLLLFGKLRGDGFGQITKADEQTCFVGNTVIGLSHVDEGD
jgi:hypothetical protein